MAAMAHTQITGHISSAKYVDTDTGRVLTLRLLKGLFPSLTFMGNVQKTGLLGMNRQTGNYEVFVRHPRWVPAVQADGSITYGGLQTEEHIMHLLGREYHEGARTIAAEVLDSLKRGQEIPYGALTIGKEQESVAHDAKTGSIVQLPSNEQVELQSGVHEDALLPFAELRHATNARIDQLIKRAEAHPGMYMMDTSVPLTGSPNDNGMQLNNGDGSSYILPWSQRVKEHLIFSDRKAVNILNAIARQHGHTGYMELIQRNGMQALWPAIACQTSIGLPHVQSADGTYGVPLEIAVATADMFNTNLDAIAEMLMASGPLVFGSAPAHLRDYRMQLRYTLTGALPAPFIRDESTLKKRWESGGISGLIFTLDRLSFQSRLPGRLPHAMSYGSAKIRIETKDPHMHIGRIENTIAGASPSLLDEIAHDAFIYLLTVAAYESVANGASPRTYFGDRFKNLSRWRQRRKLTAAFNMHGANDEPVDSLIRECLALLRRLRDTYPPLSAMATFVIARVRNMQTPPARNLREYRDSPRGPISEVMLAMYDRGVTPLEIMKETYDYQHDLAKEIRQLAATPAFFDQLNARFAHPAS
ncbi:MAG: hypothetical protein JWL85_208 [Candidatus Saccharibacteria bacterium]|nr:hypothetical protein [Candidatus Saccharibacteria bacterium]